ncbi:unnamed protein product [Arabidopsis halleri]
MVKEDDVNFLQSEAKTVRPDCDVGIILFSQKIEPEIEKPCKQIRVKGEPKKKEAHVSPPRPMPQQKHFSDSQDYLPSFNILDLEGKKF